MRTNFIGLMVLVALSLSGCGKEIPASLMGPTGPKGEAGDDGVRGANGTNGLNGTGLTLVSAVYCAKIQIVSWTSQPVILTFYYDSVTYSNGAVWNACRVKNQAVQETNTTFYPASHTGAFFRQCDVGFDTEGTATGGAWEFDTLTLPTTRRITYHDYMSPMNGTTFNFAPSECATY